MNESDNDLGDRLARLLESRTLPLALTGIWAVISLAYFAGYLLTDQHPPIGFVKVASALVGFTLPLMLVWGAHAVARAFLAERQKADRLEEGMEILYAEIQSLKSEISTLRSDGGVARPISLPDQTAIANLAIKLDQISGLLQPPEPSASPEPEREPPRPAPTPKAKKEEPSQPLLPMEDPADPAILTRDEMVSALNFPKDERDKGGFAVLRKARNNRDVAPVLQAAEDILTLLSQKGVYMDDFTYTSVPVQLWRRFAKGARGGEVAAMAALLDDKAIEKTRETMRTDPVFRDTSLHFQRRFDVTLATFCEGASDAELAAFANTRTARAFVLLSKVSGAIG